MAGSTTGTANAVATIASTALPPCSRIVAPDSAARQWLAATIPARDEIDDCTSESCDVDMPNTLLLKKVQQSPSAQPQAGIEVIAQPIAQHIDTEDSQAQCNAGKRRRPPSDSDVLDRVRNHEAPIRRGRWKTETQK